MSDSSKKFDEALHLLNEAAREKKDELQKLLGEKYSHIKDALHEVAINNRETVNRIRRSAEETWDENSERLKEAAADVDEKVRKNPWPYIGGVALGALLLGFIMGSSSKK